MEKTIKNLKEVYKYGKEYKSCIILEIIGSIIAIMINILLPIFAAKQIVDLTDNLWEELIYMSIVILVVNIVGELKTVLIRKNTQKFTVGITKRIQNKLGEEILKISQTDLDLNSSGIFVQRMISDTAQLANMFMAGIGRIVGIISSLGIFISIFIINKYVLYFMPFVQSF